MANSNGDRANAVAEDGQPLSHPVNAVDKDRQALMQLAAICTLPMALRAVIELQIPEIIARIGGPEGAVSAEEMASALAPHRNAAAAESSGPNPNWHNLERIMRALVSHGIFDQSSGSGLTPLRKFSLNSVSRLLLDDKDGLSLAPFVQVNTNEILLKPLQHFAESVLEGQNPFKCAYGVPVFGYIKQNPALTEPFNRAMSGQSVIYVRSILDSGYGGFEGANTLVDVGGGRGTTLSMIIAKYPHIRGINFDLPHVLATAPPLSGVEHFAGSMFDVVPKGDTILMKLILHNWNDDMCLKLLRNCFNALPDGGKLILGELLVPEQINDHSTEARVAHSYDLIMMAIDNGRERTLDEYNGLLRKAGFSSLNIVMNLDFISIMEAFKIS